MKSTKYAPAILFSSLVIIMLGFGIVMPLMAFFVTHFKASGGAMGLLMASYSIMQFIFAPLWGKLSDRIGRKPVLLIGIAGYAISFLMQGFAQSLVMLILSRALAGILSSATLPTAMAYMADITSNENRSKGVGLMGAAMGVGMIFGPMLGGMISTIRLSLPEGLLAVLQTTTNPQNGQLINLSIPFLFSSFLAFIALPLVQFLLPESLHSDYRKTRVQQKASATGSRLFQLKNALLGPIGFLFLMSLLLTFALANMESVLSLYGQDRFQMGPADIGYIMGSMGILSVIGQGLLIGPLTRKYGEPRLLLAGLFVSMVGLIGLALIPTRWGMIISALVFSAGNVLLQPSVTSLISQKSSPSEQGTAMGYSNSFQSLGRAIGPLWAGSSYDIYATVPFWSGAIIQLVALIIGAKSMLKTLKPISSFNGFVKEVD